MNAPVFITYTTKIESNLTTDLKTCKSIEVFKELCENFNLYEKIPDDVPVHPYFDFDYYHQDSTYEDVSTTQLVDLGKTYITKAFEEIFELAPEYCVLTSSSSNYNCYKTKQTKWKISFHIVIKNCLMLKSHLNNFYLLNLEWVLVLKIFVGYQQQFLHDSYPFPHLLKPSDILW
jgi:hypothetical protein